MGIKQDKEYNPYVKEQLKNIEESWGDSQRNRENMIRTGIKSLDELFYGIDPSGELIAIQGQEKNRKTTLAVNWIVNMALDEFNREKHIVVDTLESQMDFQRYRDTMIAMLMVKFLVEETNHRHGRCPVCGEKCRLLDKLSPEFFRYRRDKLDGRVKTDFNEALGYATAMLGRTNIMVYDGRIGQGQTRNLEKSRERWKRLAEEGRLDLLFIDHTQQYHIQGISSGDHFQHLNHVVDVVSTTITEHAFPVVLLAQVSKGSIMSASNPSEYQSSGGPKLSQEASVVITTKKSSNTSFDAIVGVSRVSGTAKVSFNKVDASSGFIIDKNAELSKI